MCCFTVRIDLAKRKRLILFSFFLKDRKNVWIVKNYGRKIKRGIGEANHRVLGKLKGLYKEKSHYRVGNCYIDPSYQTCTLLAIRAIRKTTFRADKSPPESVFICSK